ncbi:MAG: hypothetical protein ACK5P5_04450 [Pseudobdellovibrionaceae bacterium]
MKKTLVMLLTVSNVSFAATGTAFDVLDRCLGKIDGSKSVVQVQRELRSCFRQLQSRGFSWFEIEGAKSKFEAIGKAGMNWWDIPINASRVYHAAISIRYCADSSELGNTNNQEELNRNYFAAMDVCINRLQQEGRFTIHELREGKIRLTED